jgi:hypothetical protein
MSFARHLAKLHLEVTGKSRPASVNWTANEVWLGSRRARCPMFLSPSRLHCQSAQHRRLARPGRRAALSICRIRRIPKIGKHMDTARFEFRHLRILVLVDQILVNTFVHQLANFGFDPSLAERREVLARVPIKQQFIVHQLIRRLRICFWLGKPVFWQGIREEVRSEHLVVET